MFYEKELTFLRNILKNMRLNSYIVPDEGNYEEIDFRLRKLLFTEDDYISLISVIMAKTKENVIYKMSDSFLCNYVFLQLPDSENGSALIIGPYLDSEITKEVKLKLADKFNIDSKAFVQFESYYQSIPYVANDSFLFSLLMTLGELIWGSSENFTVENIEEATTYNFGEAPVYSRTSSDKPQLSLHLLESRYEKENKLMKYVSQGLTNKVDMLINSWDTSIIEQRTTDRVRNSKNYSIILNTLLRKAAESGNVHPYYIDSLSSEFASRIEVASSTEEINKLQREMMRSYCQLVKKHNMKNYSPLIQKVITTIDSEITSDLSLKAMSDMLGINPSYLSSLFKKETGSTLTDYVNKKRTEYAARLLKTTNMQIQTISQYCGIYDVNYFTKIFKKYTGKTPKSFRESL